MNAAHGELEAGLHGAGDGLLLVAGALDLGALAGASETLSTLAWSAEVRVRASTEGRGTKQVVALESFQGTAGGSLGKASHQT